MRWRRGCGAGNPPRTMLEDTMRNKLRLELEQLAVESFDTASPAAQRGTVLGEQQCTCPTNCSCPGCYTCDNTCPNTCAYTCDDASCANTCDGTCNWTCYETDCDCSVNATRCGNYICP